MADIPKWLTENGLPLWEKDDYKTAIFLTEDELRKLVTTSDQTVHDIFWETLSKILDKVDKEMNG